MERVDFNIPTPLNLNTLDRFIFKKVKQSQSSDYMYYSLLSMTAYTRGSVLIQLCRVVTREIVDSVIMSKSYVRFGKN